MGIFNSSSKKMLEESEVKIEQLSNTITANEKELFELKEQVSSLKIEQKKQELGKETLEFEILKYTNLLADDSGEIQTAKERLKDLYAQIEKSTSELSEISSKFNKTKDAFDVLSQEYITMDEVVLLQSFALYTPKYNFANSVQYKERLSEIRTSQAQMIKDETAAICLKIWSVEGSAAKGKKLTADNIKQIIRTFNTECDNVIHSVKFSNFDASKKRILKSFDALNKLNALNKIVIQNEYLELKYQELDLAYEYAQKLQEEKEELRQQREARKEEIRLAKELEEKRTEVEKEQQHYLNAMNKVKQQIACENNQERLIVLKIRENEILQNLVDVDAALKDLDYREANQRAGYVYVISNIGAFGENVYKIGMTRRLDPQDRVDELGGASVPFRFDIHAMIFSNDAPKLETALHQAFESKKVNAVNGRKEFFRVTLDEIEGTVKKNHDKTVDFIKYPEAQQYRESKRIKELESHVLPPIAKEIEIIDKLH